MARRQPLDPEQVRAWLATAERGDLATLRKLAAAEPGLIDAPGQGPYWTGNARAIHFAAYRGHLAVLRWLLAHGSVPGPIAGEFDWAPIHFASMPYRKPVYDLLV